MFSLHFQEVRLHDPKNYFLFDWKVTMNILCFGKRLKQIPNLLRILSRKILNVLKVNPCFFCVKIRNDFVQKRKPPQANEMVFFFKEILLQKSV